MLMKNFLFTLVLLLSLCFLGCTEKTLNDSSEQQNEYPVLSAGDILNNLGSSFKTQTRSGISEPDFIYPDYYGGGYLDVDGNVVVLVKGSKDEYVGEFQRRTLSSNVVVKECLYSYNELVQFNELITKKFMDESLREGLHWTSVGIDTEANRIVVGIIGCTEQAIANFKSMVLDSDVVIFKEGGEGVLDSSVDLGGNISYLDAGGSLGYRARGTGGSGFVTAGHCVPKVGGFVYIDGSYGADCKNTQYAGSFDGAFCLLRSGYSVSNVTKYGKVVVKAELVPLANMKNTTIVMEGRSTAKASSGIVSSVSESQTFTKNLPGIGNKTYTISNLIYSSYPSAGGDSGGIVYDKSSSKVVGVHTGRRLTNNKFVGSFTSYAGAINSAYGLTLE